MNPQTLQVLLVEDDASDVRVIQEALQKELDVPFELTHVDRLSAARDVLAHRAINVVLLDLQLPDSFGLDGITRIREVAPNTPIVILTASDDDGLAIQALQKGAQDYLVKGYVQVYRNLLRRSMRYAIERSFADRELRQAHRQNEQLLTSITSLLISVSKDGFITHWNNFAESSFGLSAKEMVGQLLSHEGITWERARILRGVQECRSTGNPVRLDDVYFKRPNGQEALLGVTLAPMRDEQNQLAGFLIFGADVTDRKLVEEALRESEVRYRSVIAAMAEGVLLQDAEGRIRTCNTSAEHILGFSAQELQGKALSEIVPRVIHEDGKPFPPEAQPTRITLRTGKPCSSIVMGLYRSDGNVTWISVNAQPLYRAGNLQPSAVVTSFSEITDRKKAEADRVQLQGKLDQAQKMETVGRFAGGIAHDFENFLQVILGFAWMIRSRHKDDEALLNDLQEIVHAAESASGMVRQLLAFSRRQALKPTVLEVSRTVEQMEKLLKQLVGEAIQVKLVFSSESLLVQVDPTAFEQIVMNLCSNARDSMREGGTLTVQTALVTADEAFQDAHPTLPSTGSWVRISVSDTGMGMDPAVAAHIFEPFFTTKKTGHGTGLGLAVVYGLVRQHDGFIDVDTAYGKGATFHVYLAHQVIGITASKPEGQAAAGASSKSVSVFIADADKRQQGIVADILREAGFSVSGLCADEEVLKALKSASANSQVLILAGSRVETQGLELVQQLQKAFAGMRILVLSGRRDERLRRLAESGTGFHVLRTPFVPSQLMEAIRGLLNPQKVGATTVQTTEAPSSAHTNGKSRVLIVDDDAAVRKLCRRILENSYDVVDVSSGKEALTALGSRGYDVLLTDLKMPEMDGFELIAEALKRRPDLRVMAMSGLLTDDMEKRLRRASRSCSVLRKPFTATALEEAVRKCL